MKKMDVLLRTIGMALGVEKADYQFLRELLDYWADARAQDASAPNDGAGDAQAEKPDVSRLPAAEYKRVTMDRLQGYCTKHGLGARVKIAQASDGLLSDEDIRLMMNSYRFPLASWHAAGEALDALEQAEISEETEVVENAE